MRYRTVDDRPSRDGELPCQGNHNNVTQLTYRETNNSTEKGENPKCRRKCRHQMNYAANKTANEQRSLPAKLVREGTHNYTADEKTGEDD